LSGFRIFGAALFSVVSFAPTLNAFELDESLLTLSQPLKKILIGDLLVSDRAAISSPEYSLCRSRGKLFLPKIAQAEKSDSKRLQWIVEILPGGKVSIEIVKNASSPKKSELVEAMWDLQWTFSCSEYEGKFLGGEAGLLEVVTINGATSMTSLIEGTK
jgi:hypothetical protein